MRHETEVPLLNGELELIGGDGDYREPKGLKQWWTVFWMETVKLWGIGGPIAFNILCQFSTSSVTSIFVGRIGDLQLSAVSISLSVIGCFSFGFLVISSSQAAMQTLVLLFVLYKTNWKNEVKLTSERMQKWGGQRIEPDKLSTDQLSFITNEPQMNF